MKETAAKGFIGMFATSSGVTVSLLPQIEQWLRIVSLFVGISVGIATFVSIIRKHRRDRHRRR